MNINNTTLMKLTRMSNWRLLNWVVRKYILRQRKFIARVQDYRMYLDLQVSGVSRALALYGCREEDKTDIFRRELQPGMVHMDLGANIGYYALMAAGIVGQSGRGTSAGSFCRIWLQAQ